MQSFPSEVSDIAEIGFTRMSLAALTSKKQLYHMHQLKARRILQGFGQDVGGQAFGFAPRGSARREHRLAEYQVRV